MVWERRTWQDNREQVKDRPELPWDDSFVDHIRILDNVLDHAICDDCIDMFDDLEYRGLCHTRKDLGMHFGQRYRNLLDRNGCDGESPYARDSGLIHNDVIESWQIKYPIIDSVYMQVCIMHK